MVRKFMKKRKDTVLSLKQLIEENHKLLTSRGVFIALTMFTSNLALKPLGTYLSSIFLGLSIIIWIEVVKAMSIDLEKPKRPYTCASTTSGHAVCTIICHLLAYYLV